MDLAQFLDQVDLTKYEKSVIIELSRVPSASASALVRRARVPQGRVYDVLRTLVEKGIVIAMPGSPKLFAIPDVRERLSFYLQMQENELIAKQRSLKDLTVGEKEFTLQTSRSVAAFTGRDEHVRALSMLEQSARKQLLFVAPLFVGSFSSRKDLRDALERGVEVKVITLKVTAKNKEQVNVVRGCGGEVRVLGERDLMSLCVRDGKDVLLGADNYRENEERVTILSSNPALRDALTQVFWQLWARAKKV